MNTDSVTEFFRFDHDRLNELFEQFRKRNGGNAREASHRFREYRRGLQQHIRWEEDIMFPLYETRAGQAGHPPIEDMWQEHRRLEQLTADLDGQLCRREPVPESQTMALLELMTSHDHKEESIVYPLIDDTLSDQDRDRLFARLRLQPKEPVR